MRMAAVTIIPGTCGVEGPSRKLALRQMRERQMRAAFP